MRKQGRKRVSRVRVEALRDNSAENVFWILIAVTFLILSLLVAPTTTKADTDKTLGQLVRELDGYSPERARLTASPISLSGGSELTVIAPNNLSDLRTAVGISLRSTHEDLADLFGELPSITASVRLLDETTFHRLTGAPRWTNALFYRGQIMIPLSNSEPPDFENISRAARHEYAHAVIHALSNGRAPGWLDEGLAQWIEGEENPALKPALQDWLSDNPPVPLRLLQGGFTRLRSEMVPAAYAQSLFSATVLINTYGFPQIKRYFDSLRKGESKERSFESAFGFTLKTFEDRLGRTLHNWNNGSSKESING